MKLSWAWLSLACLLVAPAAHAQSDDEPLSLPYRLYTFTMAVLSDEGESGAGGMGASGFLLAGPFELGATLSGETQLLGYHRVSLGAHAGLRVPIARFELEAAATLGGAVMHEQGSFLSDDPGAGGSIGFAGGRAGVEYVFHRSASRRSQANLALVVSYERDLEPYTVEYTYIDDSSWFGDSEPTEVRGHKRIGMDRAAIMVAIGIGFD